MARISIKPEREYLREIVTKLQDGVYAIPAFQRDFVWHRSQILDLFDSISKGYPIGSIIMWKPKNGEVPPAKDVVTEKIIDEAGAEYYILDGRQRTTAFYGCVSDFPDKPSIFQLYYNLDDDCFVYRNRKNVKWRIYPVSEVYDTYKMLGVLQQIMAENIDDDKKKRYIERVKEVNTILQTYEIGEMFIENCTLDESSTVFSRINSKGTDISKVFMLQALSYKTRSSLLLADEINKIAKSLSRYGFSNIKSDDILNCCYAYIGKKFYDNNVLEFLIKSDLTNIIPRLRVDLIKAVEFLYNRCGVINYKILPYTRQLIAIASYFKDHQAPEEQELEELEKWFFYTTYQQVFLNSSLGNIRPIFRRFDEFLNGTETTAIDYEAVDLDANLDFKFTTSSALSNFIAICQVLKRRTINRDTNLEYIGEYRYVGDKPANTFVLLTSDDRGIISDIINGYDDSDGLEKYLLSESMLEMLSDKKISLFLHMRRQAIVSMIKEKLEACHIDINPDSIPQEMQNETDINAFLYEFDDLDNEERREICEVLENKGNYATPVFKIVHDVDGTFTVSYGSFNANYRFTEKSAREALMKIEEKYCNGETPSLYFAWLTEVEKD